MYGNLKNRSLNESVGASKLANYLNLLLLFRLSKNQLPPQQWEKMLLVLSVPGPCMTTKLVSRRSYWSIIIPPQSPVIPPLQYTYRYGKQ